MSNANKCDRCEKYFQADQSRRRYQLREDVLRNTSIDYRPRDLCPGCYSELEEWWKNK